MRRAAAALLLAACGASPAFTLSGVTDNDPAALARALAIARPKPAQPLNRAGRPLAFLIAADENQLVAWDLQLNRALWTAPVRAASRAVPGGDVVVVREADSIVALDLADGRRRFAVELPKDSQLLGLAADEERVFYAVAEAGRVWRVVALGRDGRELWRAASPGQIGAPAARGGLVFIPFLSQWINLVDAATGEPLARVRVADQSVSFVRPTSNAVFYGSRGVFTLGTPRYATTKVSRFPNLLFGLDVYNPSQLAHGAHDRLRLLWHFAGDRLEATLFAYRFFFGLAAAGGSLRWVAAAPRNDIVAADDDGAAILYVSAAGELGAIDHATGALLGETATGLRVTGASFDADGYRPAGSGTPPPMVDTLMGIASDRDARFAMVKLFAVDQLAALPGTAAAGALVRLAASAPRELAERAAEALVARKDPESKDLLASALAVRADYATDTAPRNLDLLARAAGALADPRLGPALLDALTDPATPLAAVAELAAAVAASGDRDAAPELAAFLLLHRCDGGLAAYREAAAAVIDALLVLGGTAGHEIVVFVASDPLTEPALAELARRALLR